MKAKDLILALQELDPESNVVINIVQSNHAYGVVQLPICYGSPGNTGSHEYNDSQYLNTWVNMRYNGSITIHLPDGAYISKLPKDNHGMVNVSRNDARMNDYIVNRKRI